MSSNKYILLVEDNPDDVKLTQRAFRKWNIANDIVVAEDGAKALEHLFDSREKANRGEAHPRLALILLDLTLPKVNGLEVLQRLRADPPFRRTPVVMLTSSQEEQDILRSYDLGANSYILKPVDFQQFAEAARLLGMYWLLLNEVEPTEFRYG